MFKGLQHLHILVWWIILLSGLWAVFKAWRGQLSGAAWTKSERIAGLVFSMALATQLLIGLGLYSQSPVVRQLLGGERGMEPMVFGLLHPLVMFTAVVLVQVGYSLSKRVADDRAKYRIAALCYTVALVIVLLAVPWPFMPYGRSLIP